MTKFKDVAHLYLGCECRVEAFGGIFIEQMRGIKHGQPLIGGKAIDLYAYKNFKPLLRPLSDMTDEEAEFAYHAYHDEKTLHLGCVKKTVYLLSRGFDLFGLIESGEAIDKTKPATNNATANIEAGQSTII